MFTSTLGRGLDRLTHLPPAWHVTAHEALGCFKADQRLSGCTRNIPVCLPSHWPGVCTKPFFLQPMHGSRWRNVSCGEARRCLTPKAQSRSASPHNLRGTLTGAQACSGLRRLRS